MAILKFEEFLNENLRERTQEGRGKVSDNFIENFNSVVSEFISYFSDDKCWELDEQNDLLENTTIAFRFDKKHETIFIVPNLNFKTIEKSRVKKLYEKFVENYSKFIRSENKNSGFVLLVGNGNTSATNIFLSDLKKELDFDEKNFTIKDKKPIRVVENDKDMSLGMNIDEMEKDYKVLNFNPKYFVPLNEKRFDEFLEILKDNSAEEKEEQEQEEE